MEKIKQEDNEKPITKHFRQELVQNSEISVKEEWTEGRQSITFNQKGGGDTKIFSIKFSHDDKYIAGACECGEIRIYNARTNNLSYCVKSQKNTPYSYVKWRPNSGTYKTKNVFVTLNSEGEIQHHHLASGKLLSTIKEEAFDPQLYCLDYNSEATKFGVGGAEPIIKIYDEETRKKLMNLGGEELYPPGHNSRVYCVKFSPDNPNILYSGGWDNRVVKWDLRDGRPTGMGIQGPNVCGEGIDLFGNTILTSSWRETNQLQTWDDRGLKLITNIGWNQTLQTSHEPIFLYAGQFSKVDGTLILAGGSNLNEVKLFDKENQNKAFCVITELCRDVECVDFSNKGNSFVFSGGDGYVRLFSMNVQA